MSSRLFVHHGADPYFNMGFDEWLLGYVAGHPGALIWRLYTWQVGTITFGFNQRRETAYDHSKLGDTPVIRRITGGRAVFHDLSELTYSVAFNSTMPACAELGRSPAQSSEWVAHILAEFLRHLGIESRWEEHSSPENARSSYFHKAACFASHARHELSSDGAKVVASARRDWNGGVLQHGSIKLFGLQLHPALHSQPQGIHAPTKSIGPTELNSYAESLSRVLQLNTGMASSSPSITPDEQAEIAFCVSRVSGLALEKRELIAQFKRVGSQ